jgi:hypothetical protein
MRLLFTAVASLAAITSANAQGISSVTRPAGIGFSVTTGIGSSATLTTHPPAPPPAFTTSHPIVGLFPYVPGPRRQDDRQSDEDRARASAPKPTPSPYQAANSIGRDRVESPHDAAFSKDNYFRQQEEKARAGR